MTDTYATQQARRQYIESRILSAQPIELVQMLYQLAMDNLRLAVAHLKDGDISARSRAVSKARGAVTELTLALDHSVDAAFSQTLAGLYAYVQRQILKGQTEQSESAFREALSVLTTLWEGWSKVNTTPGASTAAAVDEHPLSAVEIGLSDRCSEYSQSFSVTGQSRDWSC